MRLPAQKGAEAVKNNHASTVSQPETQLHAALFREELSWATKWYCPPAVGYLRAQVISDALDQDGTLAVTNIDASSHSDIAVHRLPRKDTANIGFSLVQVERRVLVVRINPYTKETGPPLTRPEPMVLQTVSHVAMRETARERVDNVLKFLLTCIKPTQLAILHDKTSTTLSAHVRFTSALLTTSASAMSGSVLVTLLATGFNSMAMAAGDCPFDTVIQD